MAQARSERTKGAEAQPEARVRSAPATAPRPSIARTPLDGRRGTLLGPVLPPSAPGDGAEREAEATARRVVAMPAPMPRPIAGRERRMPARMPATAPAQAASPGIEGEIKRELGGGRPLPLGIATFMAPRFGADFTAVRVHTDARAASLANRLGARAFTFGRDIFFNAGEFRPDSADGKELIAHELTHTIQQREVVQRQAAPAAPARRADTSDKGLDDRVIEFMIEAVAPALLPYLKKAGPWFRSVLKDLKRFFLNLWDAAKLGFAQFTANFGKHITGALLGWLTGSLAGTAIYLPTALTGPELMKLALSVLDVTWETVRQKLVYALGPGPVKVLEGMAGMVQTLNKGGIDALVPELLQSMSDFKDMLIREAISFLTLEIVEVAATRLLPMVFPPLGAVINVIIVIYQTIMFLIERFKQIKTVVQAFVDSIQNISAGIIGAAANRIETAMEGVLSLTISYLARLVGLGQLSKAVTRIVGRIRKPVHAVIDKVIAKVATWGREMLGKVKAGTKAVVAWWKEAVGFTNKAGETHKLYFKGAGSAAKLMIASDDPQSVEHYLATYADKSSPEFKTANQVFQKCNRVIFTPQAKDKAEDKRRKQVAQALAEIMEAFAKLSGKPLPKPENYPPTTKPDYASLEVTYLVGTIPLGTKTNGKDCGTPGWAEVKAAGLTEGDNPWVQMHIISHQLGGDAVAQNLVPAPTSVNVTFQKFEHATRDLAKKKTGEMQNVVWATFKVSRDGNAAKSISGTSGLYGWVSPNWLKAKKYTYQKRVEIPPPIKASVISLNNATKKQLGSLGIGSKLVDLIVQGRVYTTMEIFVQSMEKRAAGENIEGYAKTIRDIRDNPNVVLKHDRSVPPPGS